MLLSDASTVARRRPGRERIVVIGSGAVGLYLASELSDRDLDVLVLESGGVHLDSFASESHASVGRKHDGLSLGRSRSLGGTTNLWGGQLVEFQAADFRQRDGVCSSDWPVTFEEIRRYYGRTYDRLGIPEEAQRDAPVLEHFLGPDPPLDEGLEVFLTRWLKVPSFAVSYAKPIRERENLSVLLSHTAVGFVGSGDRITAARAMDRSGQLHTFEGDRFILAAGTIEISRLLLHAARADDWQCPWRDNDHVGARFQDHLGGAIASVRPYDSRRFFETFCTMVRSGHKYQPKVRLTEEARERAPSLSNHGMFLFESSVAENLVYLKQFLKAAIYSRKISGLGDLFVNLRACARYLVPLMWKYVVSNRIFVPSDSKISLVVQAEQVPLPESRIRIDEARRDASGLPRVVLDWRLSGRELASIRDFALRCDHALRSARLAELEIREGLIQLEPRFLDTLRDTNHSAGGACMARSASEGVVDENLRVFGTDNLYVAGAATFPSSSGANTTFTALAFATRLVDHLAGARAND